MSNKPVWIAAIARGHNASVCLLKDGHIVFSIEEERLSRKKYDGSPFASMIKILEYTDKLDYLVVAHTQSLQATAGKIDFTGDDMYTGMARKLGLIDRKVDPYPHPQVIDLSHIHHKLHAACAFYRSGFDTAVSVIVDGAGTFIPMRVKNTDVMTWEVESIFKASYPDDITTVYKHYGTRDPIPGTVVPDMDSAIFNEPGTHEALVTDRGGIVKAYEAVTEYCGFQNIEAGKTMGLFPYGKENPEIPHIFDTSTKVTLTNRNLIVPTYPNGATVNHQLFASLQDFDNNEGVDVTTKQNRRDLAYRIQLDSQQQVLELILKAVKETGCKNVAVSGGYGLNCVANYYYLSKLPKDINLYVEPISNDAGTAIGAALLVHYSTSKSTEKLDSAEIYLGPQYNYTNTEISTLAQQYGGTTTTADNQDIVNLMQEKNIVAMFQGRSENGPRALGNRSLMFNPTFEDGKDWVNRIKRREYFRPFAGSILAEDVHEWFDLRGMQASPHMMYAVNCQPGIETKIPSIIHVDGTCRIQTVTREENPHYYDIIKAFKDKTGVPIIFNTSFNLGGEPLVETLEDALWTLQQSEIEYLYLPEYNTLIKIPNK